MCGRFTQRYTWDDIQDLYGLMGAARNLQAHYNIAPTDTIVKPAADGANGLVPMRWGLIPSWWKKTMKEVPATFNARAETVVDKPMFRDVFRRHRCIVPASGYYEMAKGARRQAALLHQRRRRWRAEYRRLVGPMDQSQDRRTADVLHNGHHRRECLGPPHP
jgi:putative SOS response-associated peptidase YedK